MTDCLIVGFNELSFEEHVRTVRAMGTESGAYRDLNLAFLEYRGKPYRALDVLNLFRPPGANGPQKPLSNADFLWPVITYLGTYLGRRGFSFDYVNLFATEKEQLKDKLQRHQVRTVAITTTLYVSVEPILEIVSLVRRYDRAAKIIVGGPYVHNQAQVLEPHALSSLFEYIGADVYVIGPEGEEALVNVLRALRSGLPLSEVDNIAYRDGGRFVGTRASPELNALDENMIDYGLFRREEIGEFLNVRTAKSCPFACAFCGFPQRAGRYAYLDVALVERELDAIRDLGTVTTLTFIDDTFNVPKERFKSILRMMIRKRYPFRWNSFLRSDHVDRQCIELMHESGCEGVFLGVESGSDSMLEKMNKTARRSDYLRVIPALREAGILTHANLVVGFPGETFQTVQESVELIEQAQPDFFRAQLWYCDPTTPVWARRKELGIRGSSFNWWHSTMDSATASGLVEKLLLGIENSIWLPQWGFELWSVFYLQRKGMTLSQIKTFVQHFNAAIREKLLRGGRTEVDGRIIAALRAGCRPGETRGDEPPPPRFSSTGYLAAARYWAGEFAPPCKSGSFHTLRDGDSAASDGDSAAGDGGEFGTCRLALPLREAAPPPLHHDLPAVLLAAYVVLLARLGGQEDTMLLAGVGGPDGPMVLPLRLHTPWDRSFAEVIEHVARKCREAGEHQRHALHLVTSRERMAEQGAPCPVFEAGYSFAAEAAGGGPGGLAAALADYPELLAKLDLVLQVEQPGGDLQAAFHYRRSAFRPETVRRLAGYLTAILRGAAKDPQLAIGRILVDPDAPAAGGFDDPDAEEVFDFS